MLRVKTGWVAQSKNQTEFDIGAGPATGIYVVYSRSSIHLHYSGLESLENDASILPAEPHLLRELARALQEAADELEDNQYRPKLHMLIS